MDEFQHFRINSPNTVHEVIEGEAIIINMKMGYYYSTDQAGTLIWEMITQNLDTAEMVARITDRFLGNPLEIRRSLEDFLEQLIRENLIVPDSTTPISHLSEGSESAWDNKTPFIKPELHKYTDLQDLLLLDPIHEVDEDGWPSSAGNLPQS